MSAVLRLLAAILGRHIERDEPPPAAYLWPDERPDAPVVGIDYGFPQVVAREWRDAEIADAMHAEIDRQRQLVEAANRPCWACGDLVGFHTPHKCDSHFDVTGGTRRGQYSAMNHRSTT